ncbi:hypothetical protein HYH02_000946 [Chlamydomonas schloesseri]|uniref:methenyltetrahydrofolate cyclohydrolase n=1 Tax=Chlamydomonas schloesseri TaxID=2026947 RepID=A0A835WWS7_9CHLO|nr:hypothetical protein HYH02_000946 [Chlamydomonas schloesseri]|eukprot:KAG2455126.1 hypothetical protein HYH02_000946 [Chlamydomonas schloesseri]
MTRRAVVPLCRQLYQLAQQNEQAWRRHISNSFCASGAVPAAGPPLNPVTNLNFTKPSVGGRAVILDGRAVAAAWERELVADVARLTEVLGRPPGLGVVLVGSRPDSMLYVTKKQEACQKAGMNTYVHHLPDTVSQTQLEAALAHVCADVRVDGVLIQLPLPRHLSEEAVMEVLDPRKDVDGFHPLNMGRMLMRGRGVRLVPATPLGCIELLRRSGVDVQGKNCVVLGDSNIVGTPLAAMLRDKGAAAVTICHRRSYREWFEDQQEVQRKRAAAAVCLPRLPGPTPAPLPPPPPPPPPPAPSTAAAAAAGDGGDSFQSYQLPDLTRSADILVVAVGHPELVRRDWVRPGAVVVDVGINVVSTLPRSPPRVGPGGGSSGSSGSSGGSGSSSSSSSHVDGSSSGAEGGGRQPGTAAECGGNGSSSSSSSSSDTDPGCSERRPSTTISSSTAVVSPDLGDAESSASIVAAATASVAGGSGGGGGGGGGAGGGSSSSGTGGSALYSNRNVIFQVVGDVAFDEVSQVAGAITTVPGGIGPMTIAAVLHNTLKAAKYRAGLEPW